MHTPEAIIIQAETRMKKKALFPFIVICMAALIITSCQKEQDRISQPKKLSIVATLFPLYDFAREIVGDKADCDPPSASRCRGPQF